MHTLPLRTALATAIALALTLAPIQVRAGHEPGDLHEIPGFVLERTEIALGAH